MSHQIELSECDNSYPFRKDLYACYGGGENKSLQALVDVVQKTISYEVYDHRELVFENESLFSAIQEYNKIKGR